MTSLDFRVWWTVTVPTSEKQIITKLVFAKNAEDATRLFMEWGVGINYQVGWDLIPADTAQMAVNRPPLEKLPWNMPLGSSESYIQILPSSGQAS